MTLQNKDGMHTVEIVNTFLVDEMIIDIRSPYEQQARPLQLEGGQVKLLPFYYLNSQFSNLPPANTYLLYCESGMMSRLQALYLHEQGFKNVKVYQPSVS